MPKTKHHAAVDNTFEQIIAEIAAQQRSRLETAKNTLKTDIIPRVNARRRLCADTVFFTSTRTLAVPPIVLMIFETWSMGGNCGQHALYFACLRARHARASGTNDEIDPQAQTTPYHPGFCR